MNDHPERPQPPPLTQPAWDTLSRREQEVLLRMMEGLSTDAIAQAQGTSVATVRTQIRSVLHKLDVHSQREATTLAFRSRWRPRGGR